MRLVTFKPPDGQPRTGVLLSGAVLDLAAAAPLVFEETEHLRWDMLSLLQGAEVSEESSSLDAAAEIAAAVVDLLGTGGGFSEEMSGNGSTDQGATGNLSIGGVEMLLPLEQVRMLPPLPRPGSLRLFEVPEWGITEDYSITQEARTKLPQAWYPFPAFAFGNHGAIYGPDAEIFFPASRELRYELEIACIIGRTGQDIAPQDAASYIAGYTIANDWVAYDTLAEERSLGTGAAKARDFATSLGPWLATPDELELYAEDDGRLNLTMVARVNSIERSRDNFGRIYYTFADMIAYASRDTTIYPGDVLCSGGLIGYGPPLEHGDRVELEVTALGILRNRIV